jgi:MoaA/NifB/PqqE/SkfB family radical SAM enzyme
MEFKTIKKLASGVDPRDLAVYGFNYVQHARDQNNPALWTPKSLSVEVTYWCNRRCQGCYIPDNIKRNPTTIDPKFLESVVGQAIESRVPFVGFAGGEPLSPASRDLIFDIIERHPQNPFFVYTNADFLKDVAPEIRRHHNLSYMVSLDGLEASHDKIRGKSSFKRVSDGFKELASAKKVFGASVTVRAPTYDEIKSEEFFNYLSEHGVKFLRIRMLKSPEEEMSPKAVHDMVKATREYSKQHGLLLSWGGLENPKSALPARDLLIGMDGTLRATRFDLEESFGNLQNESLKQIIRNIRKLD